MAEYVCFINGESDWAIFTKYYRAAKMVRLSRELIDKFKAKIQPGTPLWLDPAVDGYDEVLSGRQAWPAWERYMRQFPESALLEDTSSLKTSDQDRIKVFVEAVLNGCLKHEPHCISVPQLPWVKGTSRNMINRELAEATSQWKLNSGYKGKFILPVIFTHQSQLRIKSVWNPKLDVVMRCCENAGADSLWVVDSSLSDQAGSDKFAKRFQALVRFHEDFRQRFAHREIISGPYWGMNLVLWARGLSDYPAVTMGTAYQYRLSGGYRGKRAKIRVAIPPLRRWAVAGRELRHWLDKALRLLNQKYHAYDQLLDLRNNYDSLLTTAASRDQVARFYKSWLSQIEQTPSVGRSLALYQDLSLAYVLGKQLPALPKSEAPGRAPEIVAQQLMLNCL
jgi:hypothetical protein